MIKEKKYDASTVNRTLNKVTKSTSIVFFGTFLSSIIVLIGKILIIKNWTQEDYGTFVLALSIPSIIIALGTFSLKDAIVRNLAYSRGRYELIKISEIISTSFIVYLLAGIIGSILLFLFSDFIAINIFKEPGLSTPFKIFAFALPFSKLVAFFATIFRGFDRVEPRIFFNEILKNSLFLLLIILAIYLNFEFIYIFYSFLISLTIAFIAFSIFSIKKLELKKKIKINRVKSVIFSDLLLFSLPLFGMAIVNIISKRVNILMLGGMKGVGAVGLYGAVVPIASFISFPLTTMTLIYLPIVSGLYSKKKYNEINRNFSILIKWISLLTLPIFIVFVFFSEEIILLLFKQSYVVAANAFRLACLSGLLINLLGLNNQNLIVIGSTKTIFISFLIAGILNIVINFFLIPQYAVFGAVTGTIISVLVAHLFMTVKVYKKMKIQPFSKNMLKTSCSFLLISVLIYLIIKDLPLNYSIYIVLPILILIWLLFCLIMLFSLIITRSVDIEDINMIESIEKKTGLKLGFLKKLFRKAL